MIGTEDRYARQTALAAVGEAGQARLAASRVLVVGAGGLGAPVLLVLAGAGVGSLTVVDHDRVALSNLHRQPLYRTADIGRLKVESARDALIAYNPEVAVRALAIRLGPDNAAELVAGADIVVDAADSLAATYMLSDACLDRGVALVSASVLEQSGYVGAFCAGAPSYRAVFPDMPSVVGSCVANGVLGSATWMVGSLQAHMVLQIALRTSPSPLGRLVSVDLHRLGFGGFGFMGAPEPGLAVRFIGLNDLRQDDILVDLRDAAEAPIPLRPDAIRSSLSAIENGAIQCDGRRLVLYCRSGVRAHRAARLLQQQSETNVAVLAVDQSTTDRVAIA